MGIPFMLFEVISLKKTGAESARYVAPVIGRVVGDDKELEERDDGQRKLKSYVPFFQYIAKG